MAWFRRGATAASEIASHAAAASEGGRLAAIVSGVALLFSAYSLWETSLKQADLQVYVTDTVSYTRDTAGGLALQEAGGYEVLVVPVTIANGGARDAAVLALQIEATNGAAAGRTLRFDSAYTVDAAYFGATDNPAAGGRRPKVPFAPLVVAGRSAWSGTILFYLRDYREKKLVTPKSKVDVTLKLVTPAPSGWLERTLGEPPKPITLTLDVPEYSTSYLLSGDLAWLPSEMVKR